MSEDVKVKFYQIPLPMYAKLHPSIARDLAAQGLDIADPDMVVRFFGDAFEAGDYRDEISWKHFNPDISKLPPYPIRDAGSLVLKDFRGNEVGCIEAIFQDDEEDASDCPSCSRCKYVNPDCSCITRYSDCKNHDIPDDLLHMLIMLNVPGNKPDNLVFHCNKYEVR